MMIKVYCCQYSFDEQTQSLSFTHTHTHTHTQGVLDRFTQIQPKIIFSVNAVRYNGKIHDHLEKLKSVVEGLPDLEKVVLYPFCKESDDIDISMIPNW